MSKIIEVIVSPTGRALVQTIGFSGQECRDATRALEVALGQATAEQVTAEFYQTHSAQETNRQRA